MIVDATFVGEHGSLGYARGFRYRLRVISSYDYALAIRRMDGGGFCPYGSFGAFLRNWRDVRIIEEVS